MTTRTSGAFRNLLIIFTAIVGFGTVDRIACGEEIDDTVEEVAPNAVGGQFDWMTDEYFDQWVFNGFGSGKNAATQARNRLMEVAKTEVAIIDRLCGLNTDQKRKLELAARIDVNRLFDRIELGREDFRKARKNKQQPANLWNDMQKLQSSLTMRQFGMGSMFRKTLLKFLTSDQASKYLAVERQRRERENRARVAIAIAYLEGFVPLDSNQRKQLVTLVEGETVNAVDPGRYQTYVMLYRISRIRSERIKPFLDTTQFRVIETKLREVAGMGRWLEQQGLLQNAPKEEDELVKSELPAK